LHIVIIAAEPDLADARPQGRATQMTDRGLNPGLWLVLAGPGQSPKRLFFTQKFLSQNLEFLAVLLKKQLDNGWLIKLVFSYIAAHT